MPFFERLGAETVVPVSTPAEFRAAVAAAKPGTRIALAPGSYGGGFYFPDLHGAPGNPIVIAAADLAQPPVFGSAGTAIHLANPAHVELRALNFANLSDNGLNIDDGGKRDGPGAHHITLHGLHVSDIGPKGNHDGLKLSGVSDFRVSSCTIERWGDGGSAIDLVGCQRGLIEVNAFRHHSPEGANAVQCKGGSAEIVVRRNRFENVGGRGVNVGGSTGLEFFRPPLVPGGEFAEARNITVEGNTFVGATAAIAFVGVDGAKVRFNTIEQPGRWALRILQEQRAAGFVACRNGEFTDNVIVFASAKWAEGGVNVGSGTAPATFTFARNWWYCADRPERSLPKLPTPEMNGVYGRPPAEAKGKAGADGLK